MNNPQRRQHHDDDDDEDDHQHQPGEDNDDDDDDGGNNHDPNEEDDGVDVDPALLAVLLDRIRVLARASGEADTERILNRRKAKNALAITGGDTDLAAQIYWDDYVANRVREQQQQEHEEEDVDPMPEDNEEEEEEEDDDARQGAGGPEVIGDRPPEDVEYQGAGRWVRKRLESVFDAHASRDEDDEEEEEDEAPPPPAEEEPPVALAREDNPPAAPAVAAASSRSSSSTNSGVAQFVAKARETVRRLGIGGGTARNPSQDLPGADPANALQQQEAAIRAILNAQEERRRRRRRDRRVNDPEESVSISDDEPSSTVAAAVGSIMAAAAATRRRRQKKRQGAHKVSRRRKRRKKNSGNDADDDDHPESEEDEEEVEDDEEEHMESDDDEEEEEEKEKEDEDEGYLSDNDWLWESLVSRDSIPPSAPTDILWNKLPQPSAAASKAAAGSTAADAGVTGSSSNNNNNNTTGGGAPAAAAANAESSERNSNVIADDDEEEEDDDDEDDDGDDNDSNKTNKLPIPRTWLRAGFTLSDCTTGLALPPPSEDDLAFFAWQQQAARAANDARVASKLPPPFHCRSLTALTSIVTGLLYTGVTVQGGTEIAQAARKPFCDLTPAERKREFDGRLADVLTALLFTAATTSMERKAKVLRTMKAKSSNTAERFKWEKLERKLKLCPTCTWNEDPPASAADGNNASTAAASLTAGRRDSARFLQLAVSYTHMDSLRAFVWSHIHAFTAPGGCALFLETLLRIHGKGCVQRMMEQQQPFHQNDKNQSKNQQPSCNNHKHHSRLFLIDCNCEEKHRQKVQADPAWVRKSIKEKVNDTTPLGHDCISVLLMSLLLTGRVRASWQGWSTGPLGLGLLNDPIVTHEQQQQKQGMVEDDAYALYHRRKVGQALLRPAFPVWILRGPTCYSVLWLQECHDHQGNNKHQAIDSSFSRVDPPVGAVASLIHWNGWYGAKNRNKTTLRVVTARRPAYSHPYHLVAGAATISAPVMKTMQRVMERRRLRETEARLVSADEPLENDDNEDDGDKEGDTGRNVPLDKKEAETCGVWWLEDPTLVSHPDDAKFYPGQYRMWRYDMGGSSKKQDNGKDDMLDSKPRAVEWMPYHRLTERQRMRVDAKWGPKITPLLWTRWPQAVVDRWEPATPPPIV